LFQGPRDATALPPRKKIKAKKKKPDLREGGDNCKLPGRSGAKPSTDMLSGGGGRAWEA